MKSKLEVYALSVCFASVITLVISTGIAGYSIFRIINPKITMSSYKYERYQSNDKYFVNDNLIKGQEKSRPDEETLTKERLKDFNIALDEERRDGTQSFIQCIIFILVSTIVLIIHSKIAKKARLT